jgi:hypothetical protein
VNGNALFNGRSVFMALAQFNGQVNFNDLVTFYGRAVFNKDAGGNAVIRRGDSKIQISFSSAYNQSPIVVANYELDDTTLPDGSTDSAQAKQQRLLDGGYSYAVGNVTANGFTIFINKPAEEDINFHWLATAVNNALANSSQGQ